MTAIFTIIIIKTEMETNINTCSRGVTENIQPTNAAPAEGAIQTAIRFSKYASQNIDASTTESQMIGIIKLYVITAVPFRFLLPF